MSDTERAIEDTFILADQPYVYTEQNWGEAPGAAEEAFRETRSTYWRYMLALAGGRPVVEDGTPLTRAEMRRRCIELAGGLFDLLPHVRTAIPLVRRSVHSLLILNGLTALNLM